MQYTKTNHIAQGLAVTLTYVGIYKLLPVVQIQTVEGQPVVQNVGTFAVVLGQRCGGFCGACWDT